MKHCQRWRPFNIHWISIWRPGSSVRRAGDRNRRKKKRGKSKE